MGEKEAEKVESTAKLPTEAAPEDHVPPRDVTEEKHFVGILVMAAEIADDDTEKNSKGSTDRDAVRARVATEKRLALIKAWEESEKTKVENREYKKLCAVESWEKGEKAYVESQLRKIEGKWEKKKEEYGEKMKNKMAKIHKEAKEKRAMVEANRSEDFIKIEDASAKYHASRNTPKHLLASRVGILLPNTANDMININPTEPNPC